MNLRQHSRRVRRPVCTDLPLTLRQAGPRDVSALERLAALDSAETPAGPLLLAERDSHLLAALSLRDGSAIADPFELTDEVVSLLRFQARRARRRDQRAAA